MYLFLSATLSLFNYVCALVTDMREQPRENSKIVSQAYYAELINVLEEGDGWVKIETAIDNYPGWAKKNDLCQTETPYPSEKAIGSATVSRAAAHLYSVEDTSYGPFITLPFESSLEIISPETDSTSRWLKIKLVDGREGFRAIQLTELRPGDLIFFGLAEDKIRHVGMFLGDDRFIHATLAENAPYLRISRLNDAEWNGTGQFVYRAARTLKIKDS